MLADDDYVLKEGAGWFEVNEFAVRIREFPDGLRVTVCRNGNEAEAALGELWVPR
jgi:hypothetical protein